MGLLLEAYKNIVSQIHSIIFYMDYFLKIDFKLCFNNTQK